MAGRHRSLILVIAIILIPVLLGTTPLNLVQKLSGRCPLSQDKQIQRVSSCLFNSIVSQDDSYMLILTSTLLSRNRHFFHVEVHDWIHPNISLISVPFVVDPQLGQFAHLNHSANISGKYSKKIFNDYLA
jgi:hypothetical protein